MTKFLPEIHEVIIECGKKCKGKQRDTRTLFIQRRKSLHFNVVVDFLTFTF